MASPRNNMVGKHRAWGQLSLLSESQIKSIRRVDTVDIAAQSFA